VAGERGFCRERAAIGRDVMSTEAQAVSFAPREVKGAPSTLRTAFLKQRYLSAPLMVDIEYIRLLTESHQRTDGMETLERRAEDHAHALEHLTPVIHPQDRIVANKTRYIRGAVPYANYAAGPFLREIRKQQQDAQQKLTEQGTGGGIALAHEAASKEGMAVLSGKFLISPEDLAAFTAICAYWDDKCMMEVGDRLWRKEFPAATKDDRGRLRVGAAIGVTGDYLERTGKLLDAKVDVLIVDIAHGHSANAVEAIKGIKTANEIANYVISRDPRS
jgi:hypothetical protein